jgi:REP element-mobilizing transposase RayT
MGGTADHVHMLVSLGKTVALSDLMLNVKRDSSKWLGDRPGVTDFHWQDGYGAFAVSYSNIDQVKFYLANQEQHHRRTSFQEEFLEFLRRHDLEWDERYVWD